MRSQHWAIAAGGVPASDCIPDDTVGASEPSLRPQYVRLRSRVLVSNRQALQNVCTKRLARCRLDHGSQLSLVQKETTK